MRKWLLFLLSLSCVKISFAQSTETRLPPPDYIPLDTLLSFADINKFSDLDPRVKAFGLDYRNQRKTDIGEDYFYSKLFSLNNHGHCIGLDYIECTTGKIVIKVETSLTDFTTSYKEELSENNFTEADNCVFNFRGEGITQFCFKNEKNWVVLCKSVFTTPRDEVISFYNIVVGTL